MFQILAKTIVFPLLQNVLKILSSSWYGDSPSWLQTSTSTAAKATSYWPFKWTATCDSMSFL